MNNFSQIVSNVLSTMKLATPPKNIGTGKYSTWTQEARTHNETVVRPFRQNVASAVKVEFDQLTGKLSLAEKDALVTLLNDISSDDCMKFPQLCYGVPTRDTKRTSAPVASSVMTLEVFTAALKVASPKLREAEISKAYADYLLNA